MVGALVSANDFCGWECRTLTPKETLTTGQYRFRYYNTPQLPHGWDAGVLFEETQRTLFSSDLFHHDGDVEPLTSSSVLERVRQSLTAYPAGPLANYAPYTPNTSRILAGLAFVAALDLGDPAWFQLSRGLPSGTARSVCDHARGFDQAVI